jgi:elongation factor Tu
MTNPYDPYGIGSVQNAFLMPIEDIFTIKHRGIVVTGRIERGRVQAGDTVDLVGIKEPIRQAVIKEIEMFRKILPAAEAGNSVGCLLEKVQPGDLERGQVLASRGSIRAHKDFSAQLQMLAKEDGGRHTPFFDGYTASVRLHSVDIPGKVKLLYGMAMGVPGESFEVNIALAVPVALEVGTQFTLREGGRAVGGGICTRIDDAYPY